MDHGHDELSRPLKILKKKERKESVLLAQFSKPREEERETFEFQEQKSNHTSNHINNVNNINTEQQLYQHSHSQPSSIPSISRFYVESYFLHFFLRVKRSLTCIFSRPFFPHFKAFFKTPREMNTMRRGGWLGSVFLKKTTFVDGLVSSFFVGGRTTLRSFTSSGTSSSSAASNPPKDWTNATKTGHLLRRENLTRLTKDLHLMLANRNKIEGPNVPDARSVLVPLALVDEHPCVLLTVQSTQFGTPLLAFPRGHRSRHNSAALDKDAVAQACDQIGGREPWANPDRIEYLGTHHDAVNSKRTLAITPGVAYFGSLTKRQVQERNRSANCVLGVAAIKIEDCLEPDNVSVVKLEEEEGSTRNTVEEDGDKEEEEERSMGPMPAFTVPRANVVGWGETSEPFGLKNCLIWGSDAAILHGVLRVIVGSDERYKQQLYGQFEKIQREMNEQATKVVA
jgi:hypothetical protein